MNQLEREIDQAKRSTVYEDNGYKNRTEYIKGLADEYAVPLNIVLMYAQMFGPSEDFDGLVSTLQDHEYMEDAS
jgi:hypothetical protein|tara:strand:- start:6 stop:227 length:222 start_codon:yes stop_codon:yes gene_type:complete